MAYLRLAESCLHTSETRCDGGQGPTALACLTGPVNSAFHDSLGISTPGQWCMWHYQIRRRGILHNAQPMADEIRSMTEGSDDRDGLDAEGKASVGQGLEGDD